MEMSKFEKRQEMEIEDSKWIEIVRKHIKINSKLLSKAKLSIFLRLAPSFRVES